VFVNRQSAAASAHVPLLLLLLLPQTTIEVRLRYPLMGGWKTDFTLGEPLAAARPVH
jgi:hypothetical protein